MKHLLFVTAIALFTFKGQAQNVGIGTTTPQTKLHVFNGASGATPFVFSPLAVESNGHTYINILSPAANEGAILFGQPGSSANGVIMYNNTSTPNGFQFRNNGNLTRMVIDNAGNVGIGIVTPSGYGHGGTNRIMEISNPNTGSDIQSHLILSGNGTSGSTGGITWVSQNVPGSEKRLGFIGDVYETSNAARIVFYTRNEAGILGEQLTVLGNGNVGIGTVSPSEKLQIAGNVKANSFVYTTPKTLYYNLSGIDFRAYKSTDTTVVNVGSGSINMQNNISGKLILAAVHLPHGATMTNITAYIDDNSVSDNLRAVFYRKTILNNFFPDNLGFINSSGSSGVTTAYQTAVNANAGSNIVDNNLYTYYISVSPEAANGIWTGFDMAIRAIVIEYTLSSTQ
jgi:hypothetical protein